jgi:hypothetical protein
VGCRAKRKPYDDVRMLMVMGQSIVCFRVAYSVHCRILYLILIIKLEEICLTICCLGNDY